MPPIFSMKGVQDTLEVYDDKIIITPRGILGMMNKGLKGSKNIPFFSITAVQFKKAGLTSGYLQFTLQGGVESRGGILAAAKDENTFMYSNKKDNEEVEKIKTYVEEQLKQFHNPVSQKQQLVSLSDELEKLADLKSKGVLTDEEFQAAKKRLID